MTVHTSEMLVNFNKTTQCYILESYHLQQQQQQKYKTERNKLLAIFTFHWLAFITIVLWLTHGPAGYVKK
jgi:hypothetical protein